VIGVIGVVGILAGGAGWIWLGGDKAEPVPAADRRVTTAFPGSTVLQHRRLLAFVDPEACISRIDHARKTAGNLKVSTPMRGGDQVQGC
jgi:hypothetical protein